MTITWKFTSNRLEAFDECGAVVQKWLVDTEEMGHGLDSNLKVTIRTNQNQSLIETERSAVFWEDRPEVELVIPYDRLQSFTQFYTGARQSPKDSADSALLAL